MHGEYNIKYRRVKLNGTQQLLVYADDVNILGGSIHTIKGGSIDTIKKNTEAFEAAGKKIGLEITLRKLSMRSCLDTSMQDKITT
jgi:hypothetical protein